MGACVTPNGMKMIKKNHGSHPHISSSGSISSGGSDLKEQIDRIFAQYDSNQDGILEFNEVEKILE